MNIKKVLSIVRGDRQLENNGSVHYSCIACCIGQQHHSLFGSGTGRWTDMNHWNTSAAAPRPWKHKTVGWIGIN